MPTTEQQMPDQQAKEEPYDAFLRTTDAIVTARINALENREGELAHEMARLLFEELRSDDARNAMQAALNSLADVNEENWPNGKGRVVHKLLLDEISLFSAMHAESDSPKNGDGGLKDAETVKGSIEDLLSRWLPEWLKKLLKLLNQLLSLLRP